MTEADALANELTHGWPIFATEDAKEGATAFKEKRKANFQGSRLAPPPTTEAACFWAQGECGLAGRAPHDLLDQHQVPGRLVGRQLRAARRHQVVERRRRAGRASTTAVTACPSARRARRPPARRRTSRCAFSTPSTSSGKIFSPPELMQTEPRPSRVTGAVDLHRAKSPATT